MADLNARGETARERYARAAAPVTHRPDDEVRALEAEAACCGPDALATCCAPADKEGCCGPRAADGPSPASCGCGG
jgi:hypothetical protein